MPCHTQYTLHSHSIRIITYYVSLLYFGWNKKKNCAKKAKLYNCKMQAKKENKIREKNGDSLYFIVQISLPHARIENILLAMIFFIFILALRFALALAPALIVLASLAKPNNDCIVSVWSPKRDEYTERAREKVWILCQFLYLSHSLFASNHHHPKKKAAQFFFVFDANE